MSNGTKAILIGGAIGGVIAYTMGLNVVSVLIIFLACAVIGTLLGQSENEE